MNLLALGYFEHDLTIFENILVVCQTLLLDALLCKSVHITLWCFSCTFKYGNTGQNLI